jgi:hypothetical protein
MDDSMRTHKTNSKSSKNSKKKRSAALLAAGVIGLATAGGAYAYWTSTGSGTGAATTKAGATNIFTVSGDVAAAMYPGDTEQTVTATVTNNGTENYAVQGIQAYVTTDKPGCDGSNYLLNRAAAPSTAATAVAITVTPVDIAPTKSATAGTFTMQFNNKTTNQDACKGAAVTIHYVAS